MLKPEELRNREFEVSVLGGYKRETVDTFFMAVADDYEKLYNENNELVQKLKVCVNKIEEYRKDEQFLKTAIINAEKLNESTLKDIESREKEAEKNAKQTAESILASARAEAENIVKRARLDSEESIRAYEISADRKIDEIKISVQAEQEKLDLMKKEVSDFKEKLFKLYKQHLDSLSKLPSVSKERQQEAEKSVPESTENQEDDQHAENTVEREVHPSADIPEPDKHKEKAAVHSGKVKNSEKTAEFVIDKKSGNKENKKLAEMFDNNLKFKDLKFGTDFDLNKDD